MKRQTKFIVPLVFFFCIISITYAQNEDSPFDTDPLEQLSSEQIDQQEQAVLQLREIQESLTDKLASRRDTQSLINQAGDNVPVVLQSELKEVNSEIQLLETTFEQIAIGGIDLSVFGVEETDFNWREELVTVVEPLIANIKGLTEKPRKIESLRRVIADKTIAKEASQDALISIEQLKTEATLAPVLEKLSGVESEWRGRLNDLQREIQLAKFQLDSLEGKNEPWSEVLKRGAMEFIQGRGLTLLFVFAAVGTVWLIMRGILWLSRKRSSESQDRSVKVRYRLAAYAYRLLTGILIAIAIMVVLYVRQDLLLLAIMVIVFIGLVLALKNLLPQYIAEGRILLNMGGVRERERVIYNDLPWELSAINMYSRLTNPEIRGGIRLPISQMHEMISRPNAGDTWFPSSEGDWVIDGDGDPVKVMRQSVDVVELENLDSLTRLMPSAEYFEAGYPNLSRAEKFRITVQFGIDYATQTENVENIETAFKEGIQKSFEGMPYWEYLVESNVDFHSAGDSSLNYLMVARFKPEAAQYYNRIKRRIQRACVMVCNENNWGIPFPQVSVHLSADNSDAPAVQE